MTQSEFVKELDILLSHKQEPIESLVRLLYKKQIAIGTIYKLMCVYVREVIEPRLKVTSIRTYTEKLCNAIPSIPDEEILQCLDTMADDGRIEYSDDQSYVVWKGPHYMHGLWDREWASMRNLVDDAILMLEADNDQ